ncbi:hypothetical protein CAP35_14675 [Chitinophagaceae bacterium IBVUCB1]|nr:hypothetical protein CAP35_14675 [Chitinophagaceae bacterium IBVUCB1]
MCRWLYSALLLCLMNIDSLAIDAVVSYRVFYIYQNNAYAPYVEVYWQIDANTLNYKTIDSNTYQASVKTYITITDSAGNLIKKDAYILQTPPVVSMPRATSQRIIEIQRYMLQSGKHSVAIQMEDAQNKTNTFSYTYSVQTALQTDKLFYTLPQLLDTVYKSNVQDMFAKNGNIQIPLCADFLDEDRKYLTYYAELAAHPSAGYKHTKLKQQVYISKKPLEGVVYKLQKTDSIDADEITPVYGKLPIESLPTGNYYLNIVLTDNDKIVANSSLFFQRINSKPKVDTSNLIASDSLTSQMQVFDLSSTFVSKYSMAQLKAILKMIKPICNEVEVITVDNFLARPDDTYIRYFIYNFWKRRSALKPKEEWEKYTQLIKEVNKMFGVSGIPGYETERGIIYIKYGKPDEMVGVSNEQGTEPYEIWTYNTLPHQNTGGMLLFYRPGFMTGDFRVLHSNIRGEMRNPQWRQILYKTGRPNNGANARAEQYFPGNK